MGDPLETVFTALRERMLRSASGMRPAEDAPGSLVMKTPWDEPGKREPAWFGAVQRKKNYVSYHLMPLYVFPALRTGVAPALGKRMQGKSCFNFKTLDPELFDGLEALTAACAAAYAAPFGRSGR